MENMTVGQLDTNLRRFYAEAGEQVQGILQKILSHWFPALF